MSVFDKLVWILFMGLVIVFTVAISFLPALETLLVSCPKRQESELRDFMRKIKFEHTTVANLTIYPCVKNVIIYNELNKMCFIFEENKPSLCMEKVMVEVAGAEELTPGIYMVKSQRVDDIYKLYFLKLY